MLGVTFLGRVATVNPTWCTGVRVRDVRVRLPVKQLRFRVMEVEVAAAARRGGRGECHPTKVKARKATNQRAEARVASRGGRKIKYYTNGGSLNFILESVKPLFITYNHFLL